MKHYLILSNRLILFLSLIYLFFFFQNLGDIGSNGKDVFLDNSYSTTIEKAGVTVFDEGLSFLQQNGISNNVEFSENVKAVRALQEGEYGVYLSDFQGVNSQALSSLKRDTSSNYWLVHLGDVSMHQNLFVDSLYLLLGSQNASSQQVVLLPRVSGTSASGTAIFRLLHEGRQLSSIAQDFATLDKVVFDIPLDLKGKFTVELEGDNVFYDNKFFFKIGSRIKPKVAVISEEPNLYLEEVFSNQDVFELNILDPSVIDYQVVAQSNVIILNALTKLPSGFVSQLQKKTVIVFPTTVGGQTQWVDLQKSIVRDESTYLPIGIDYNHPLLKGVFAKRNSDSEMPFGTPIFDLRGDYEVLVTFRDGTPYLVGLPSSNTYVFNSSLSIDASNLASHAIFLPLMYQIAFSAQEYDQGTYSYPDDILHISVENQEYPPKIVSEGITLIPEFNPSAYGISIRVPNLSPGFYDLIHQDDTMTLAVNSAKEESLMIGLSPEHLENYFSNSKHVQVSNAIAQGPQLSESSVWKYALILILVFIISETFLHRFLQ